MKRDKMMKQLEELTQENLIEIIKEKEEKIKTMEEDIIWLNQKITILQKSLYGTSSEKSKDDSNQLSLFDEAEVTASPIKVEPQIEEVVSPTKAEKKKSRKRMNLDELPRKRVEHKVEGKCPECGNELRKIAENITSQLVYIPARYEVIDHIQEVCTCAHCEKTKEKSVMVKGTLPKFVIPKSIASPSLLSNIINDKYNKGLPLYRQEVSYSEKGLDLTRQTMSNWMIKLYDIYFHKMMDYMKDELKKMEYICVDETSVQVLREAGKTAESKSYMWVYKSGRSEKKQMVLFHYEPSRRHEHAIEFLKGYKGILQSDAYQAYDKVDCGKQMYCWAHVRRKYHEALEALPKGSDKKGTQCYELYQMINQLFKIEKDMKNKADYDEIKRIRQEKSKPIIEKFFTRLDEIKGYLVGSTLFKTAITYSDNQREKLMTYLEDGRIEISNNTTENSIRPFAVGRKNWLFSNSVGGARSSGAIYSLIESAKANGLVPEKYMEYLLEQCPYLDLDNADELEKVLPWSPELPERLMKNKKS